MSPAVYDQTSVDIEAGRRPLPRQRPGAALRRLPARVRGRPRHARRERRFRIAAGPRRRARRLRSTSSRPSQHFTQPPPRFTQASLITRARGDAASAGRPRTRPSCRRSSDREYVAPGRAAPPRADRARHRSSPTCWSSRSRTSSTSSSPPSMERRARRRRGRQERLARRDAPLLHAVPRGPRSREDRDARRQARGRRDRPDVPEVRQAAGDQVGTQRRVRRVPGYPECRITGNFTRDDDGTIVLDVAGGDRRGLREVRLADAGALRPFGKLPRLLGLPGVQERASRANTPVPIGILSEGLGGCGEGELVQKVSRRGKIFYSCNRYPTCKFALWDRPVADAVPASAGAASSSRRPPSAPAPCAAACAKAAATPQSRTERRRRRVRRREPKERVASAARAGVRMHPIDRSERARRLRGRLAARAPRHRRRPVRDAPACATPRRTRRIELAELSARTRCATTRCDGGRPAQGGDARARARWSCASPTRRACRPARARGRSRALRRAHHRGGRGAARHRDACAARCTAIPPGGVVILATGPLTSPALSRASCASCSASEHLYFYDAIAPIVYRRLDRHDDRLHAPRATTRAATTTSTARSTARQYVRLRRARCSRPRRCRSRLRALRLLRGLHADRGDGAPRPRHARLRTDAAGRPASIRAPGGAPFAVVQLRQDDTRRHGSTTWSASRPR